jgi:hypothetical protein
METMRAPRLVVLAAAVAVVALLGSARPARMIRAQPL